MLPIEALAEDASAMPFAVCVEWAMMVKRFVSIVYIVLTAPALEQNWCEKPKFELQVY